MKKTVLITAVIFCFMIIASGHARAIGFELSAGYWKQSPSGYVSYKPVSDTDRLDVESDLKYDDEGRPFVRARLYTPGVLPNIYFMATPMKFEADSVLSRSFRFGDQVFSINEAFYSKVELNHYDVGLFYKLPLTGAPLGLEAGLNVRIIDFYAEVKSSLRDERKSLTTAVPMVYVAVLINPADFFALEAEGRGVVYNSNHYYDFIGRVKIKPFGPFFIAGGYRYEDIKIDQDDVDARVKFKGPFIEAGVAF
ncbi:MAG: TIGR04219 family outer membrane beta-barrel protein [Nitrospirae bacterium]|nr:TIGR04219 family outer membrane beta-barrel protein [Nitrospirota bacterium]